MRFTGYFVLFICVFSMPAVSMHEPTIATEGLDTKNMDVYSTASYDHVQIAVGVDNSAETLLFQQQDEYYKSAIALSVDHGKHWKRLDFDLGVPLVSVLLLDKNTIVVAASTEGFGGEIHKSTDQGKSWDVVYTGGLLYQLIALDNKHLLAAGWGILESYSSGNSWNTILSSNNFITAIIKTSQGSLVAVSSNAEIYRSTDKGKNWLKVYTAKSGGFDGYQLKLTKRRLLLLGIEDEVVASSIDDGQHWQK
ncbi:MAG: hypothetical protein GY814_14285 [Gammaproteobacteria bacterium]|nr:hypothetical protein [Gammaproteobacteria bacterium]